MFIGVGTISTVIMIVTGLISLIIYLFHCVCIFYGDTVILQKIAVVKYLSSNNIYSSYQFRHFSLYYRMCSHMQFYKNWTWFQLDIYTLLHV